MIPKSPENRLRLVLDTNVCLDLFVFQDPRWARLLQGLREKKLDAITGKNCREEWLRVLHYPSLPITDETRSPIIESFDELIFCTMAEQTCSIKLPICSDPDDQKFMELARDAKATHLITKDHALLKCAKKVKSLSLFHIMSPEIFLQSVTF